MGVGGGRKESVKHSELLSHVSSTDYDSESVEAVCVHVLICRP